MYLLVTKFAYSTTYIGLPLDSLVEKSKHIFVAKIVEIEVIGRDGKRITDPNANTSRNTVKYHLKTDINNILKTSLNKFPGKITVSTVNKYHSKASRLKKFIGTEKIFLLSSQLSPVYVTGWMEPISKKETILSLINNQQPLKSKPKNGTH